MARNKQWNGFLLGWKKSYLDHLLEKSFTKADIVKMIGNNGARQVMEWLFTKDGEKTNLDHLLEEKKFEKDDIVKMIGNGGAKQAMEWLFTMFGEKHISRSFIS